MKGVALILVALLLSAILFPIGFIIRLFRKGLAEYLFHIAQSIDQLGNVVCDKLFSATLIKGGYHDFGNPDETISSVLGINKENNSLTIFGKWVGKLLEAIDKNHLTKAIGN